MFWIQFHQLRSPPPTSSVDHGKLLKFPEFIYSNSEGMILLPVIKCHQNIVSCGAELSVTATG